ncbi:MAG: hypothetical protein FWE36_05145 [Erysipelotrichales bacterium]|nr:hypothetical protein [Erysipelotrichales bacterium]
MMKRVIIFIGVVFCAFLLYRPPVEASSIDCGRIGCSIEDILDHSNWQEEMQEMLNVMNIDFSRFEHGEVVGLMYTQPFRYTPWHILRHLNRDQRYLVLVWVDLRGNWEEGLVEITINGTTHRAVTGREMQQLNMDPFIAPYFPGGPLVLSDRLVRFDLLKSFDYSTLNPGRNPVVIEDYRIGRVDFDEIWSLNRFDQRLTFAVDTNESSFSLLEHKRIEITDKVLFVDRTFWRERSFYYLYFSTDIPMQYVFQIDLGLIEVVRERTGGMFSRWEERQIRRDITIHADEVGYDARFRRIHRYYGITPFRTEDNPNRTYQNRTFDWQVFLNAWGTERMGRFWNGWVSSEMEFADIRYAKILVLYFQDFEGIYWELPANDRWTAVQPMPPSWDRENERVPVWPGLPNVPGLPDLGRIQQLMLLGAIIVGGVCLTIVLFIVRDFTSNKKKE